MLPGKRYGTQCWKIKHTGSGLQPLTQARTTKGDWSKGSRMLFLGPDPKTGEEGGMVSRIAENRPYEFISIEHLGILANGVEDTTSEEAKKWTPAYENYSFEEHDGVTKLSVDMDSATSYVEMFKKMWPDALQKLKTLAEAK
jgi:hypothetical protein